jgi:hypothetical protein
VRLPAALAALLERPTSKIRLPPRLDDFKRELSLWKN